MPQFIDQEFQSLQRALDKGEYENCTFLHCRFSEDDLAGIDFYACRFEQCDLSMISFKKSGLKEVIFVQCKLIGAQFSEVNPFLLEMQFKHCQLNYASFYQLDLQKSHFSNCQLIECDFQESDLSSINFNDCELSQSNFDYANLTKTDFRKANNFTIRPEVSKLKKTKFNRDQLIGLVHHLDIEIDD